MRSPPAFQCYASDWLARGSFRFASLAERGLLWSMLNQAWVSDELPADPARLALLLGLPEDEVRTSLTPNVLDAFETVDDGSLICRELATMKADYAKRHMERSVSGKRGAEARYGKKTDGSAMAQPVAQPSPPAIAAPEVRGAEVSGEEKSRGESSGKAPPKTEMADKDWIAAYDRASGSVTDPESYRRASRGG